MPRTAKPRRITPPITAAVTADSAFAAITRERLRLVTRPPLTLEEDLYYFTRRVRELLDTPNMTARVRSRLLREAITVIPQSMLEHVTSDVQTIASWEASLDTLPK